MHIDSSELRFDRLSFRPLFMEKTQNYLLIPFNPGYAVYLTRDRCFSGQFDVCSERLSKCFMEEIRQL